MYRFLWWADHTDSGRWNTWDEQGDPLVEFSIESKKPLPKDYKPHIVNKIVNGVFHYGGNYNESIELGPCEVHTWVVEVEKGQEFSVSCKANVTMAVHESCSFYKDGVIEDHNIPLKKNIHSGETFTKKVRGDGWFLVRIQSQEYEKTITYSLELSQ